MKLKELNVQLMENTQTSAYDLLIALDDHFAENKSEMRALGYVRIMGGLRRRGTIALDALDHAITMLAPHGELKGYHFGQFDVPRYEELFTIMRGVNSIHDNPAYKNFAKDVSNTDQNLPPCALRVISYIDKVREMSSYGGSLYDDLLDTELWIKYSHRWFEHLLHLIAIVETPTEDTSVDTDMDKNLIKGCLRQIGIKL